MDWFWTSEWLNSYYGRTELNVDEYIEYVLGYDPMEYYLEQDKCIEHRERLFENGTSPFDI